MYLEYTLVLSLFPPKKGGITMQDGKTRISENYIYSRMVDDPEYVPAKVEPVHTVIEHWGWE